jgi:uncharacterized protein YjbI with pentapeptide repeats
MGGLWRGIAQPLARFRWPLAGLAALVVVLACVLVVPQWLVRWELGASARTLTAPERAKAINDVRGTLLQGIGGAVLLLGAYFTYRQLQTGRDQLEVTRQQAQITAEQAREQLEIAQQGQVTERFTRATDQLGHAEPNVRLGGIYALERIANDSPGYRTTIAEVLTAFVRGHAPLPPRPEAQSPADTHVKQVPELQVRAPDIQAALTVLARRRPPPTPGGRLDLHATDLRKALLDWADLQKARLDGAQLQEANLERAELGEANLASAQLQGANLFAANLQEANLLTAQLQGANLQYAHLQGARLEGAQLQGAKLFRAELQGANLSSSQLQDATLDRAQLQGANLHGANFKGVRLDRAELENAHADSKTTWPAGFDPRRAGIDLADRAVDTTVEPES